MQRNIITILLLACLIGCGYVLQQTSSAASYLDGNFAGNADLVAADLGRVLVGSHYTGIAIVITCLLGLGMRWGKWKGRSRLIWPVALIALLLGILLITDSTQLTKEFWALGSRATGNVTLSPAKLGNWLWWQDAGLSGRPTDILTYVLFLFRNKAIASAISLGLLLVGNLLLGKQRSAGGE